MKLLFDLNSLRPPRSGVGYYTQHLLEGVLDDPDVSDVAGWIGRTVVSGRALRDMLGAPSQRGSKAPARDGRMVQVLQKARALPGLYAARSVARGLASRSIRNAFAREGYVYHETNSVSSRYRGPNLVTIHDLSHRRYPSFHPGSAVNYLERGLPRTLRQADIVIADSFYTKSEIVDIYGIDADKIVPIHLGVESAFQPRSPEECRSTLNTLGLKAQSCVLSVCTLQPRKNLHRLVEGFSRLAPGLREACPLVLVGADGWDNSELKRMIEPMIKAREVIPAGYVSRTDLFKLYSSAAVFAYPSLYEGFGLPVAEAMASGVPVLTSTATSIPEVSAGAAWEVDPFSVEEITDGLDRLITDQSLRTQLIAKGLRRASELTWSETVRKTCEVYRRLAT
jgi:glycosyltransferase involved in cell wall biosynthesis